MLFPQLVSHPGNFLLWANPVRGYKNQGEAQAPLEVNRSEKKHKENKPLTGQVNKTSNGAKFSIAKLYFDISNFR